MKLYAWIVVGLLGICVAFGANGSAFAQGDAKGTAVVVKVEKESEKNCCAYIGIYMDDLTRRVKEKLRFPHETGVLITRVEEGSPAENAGLAADDVVYRFDGNKVENSAELATRVRERKPGEKVTLVFYRNGSEKKVTVTLGKRESPTIITDDFGKYSEELSKSMREADKSAMRVYREALRSRGRLGMVVHDLNQDLASYFDVKKGEGVLVLDVESESPAEKAGIKSGDVVVGMNGDAVSNVEEFMDALSGTSEGDTLSLEIVRRGTKKTVEVEVEEGFGSYRFYIAPFERSGVRKEPLEQYFMKKSGDDTDKLKQEMEALKERLRELEDRLDKTEKR